MKIFNTLFFCMICICDTYAQTFRGKTNQINKYEYYLKIEKDSSVVFAYRYLEQNYFVYNGKIRYINGEKYKIQAELELGAVSVKSLSIDTFRVHLDSNLLKRNYFRIKDYIILPKSKNCIYLRYFKNEIYGFSYPIKKSEYEFAHNQYYFYQMARKNLLNDDFLYFKIKVGSDISFSRGNIIDFDVMIIDNNIETVLKTPEFGKFKLIKMKK